MLRELAEIKASYISITKFEVTEEEFDSWAAAMRNFSGCFGYDPRAQQLIITPKKQN